MVKSHSTSPFDATTGVVVRREGKIELNLLNVDIYAQIFDVSLEKGDCAGTQNPSCEKTIFIFVRETNGLGMFPIFVGCFSVKIQIADSLCSTCSNIGER